MSAKFTSRCLKLLRTALLCVVVQAGSATALAHEGPPFPILMDKPAAGYLVSVWADPDIGEALFYIIVETPDGGMPRQLPRVSMWVEPVNGRLDRVTCEATRQTLKNQVQFEANPYFDQRDMWTVGFQLTSPDGKSAELTTVVESTPPGYGLWDLAIYLFPFLFLGGFWAFAMARRRRIRQMEVSNRRAGTNPSSPERQTDRQTAGIRTDHKS